MSMPFCSACTPFALEIMIGRVPFVAAVCKAQEPASGFSDPNTLVVPAAAVPANEVRKNLRRDQRLIVPPRKRNRVQINARTATIQAHGTGGKRKSNPVLVGPGLQARVFP